MMGPVVATHTVNELSEFDGEMIPTHCVQVVTEMQEQLVTITDASFDPFDDSVFATPESNRTVAGR